MPAHRMVHSFQPKQTYIVNVQNNISRPQPTNVGGGFGWAFALPAMMMGLSSIFGMMGAFRGTSQQTPATLNPNQGVPQTTNDEAEAKKKAALDDLAKIFGCTVISSEPGKYTVMYGKYPLATDKDYYAARDAMLGIGDGKKTGDGTDTGNGTGNVTGTTGNGNGIGTEDVTGTTGNGNGIGTEDVTETTGNGNGTVADTNDAQNPNGKGGKDIYEINKKTGNTTYKVEKGNTWYGIVSAKYDISGLSGKQILELAIQLAAANSEKTGEAAIADAHNGIYFKVGDVIKLPKELTIGDTTVSLKEGETPNATDDSINNPRYYADSHAPQRSFAKTTVQQVGDKWQLLKNGEVIHTFDTEAEAQAKKAELEKDNS